MKRPVAFALISLMASHAPAPKWRLVEEWRVGGAVEGPLSFADVRALRRLPNGGLVVLEFKEQKVHFLDARGKPVRSVGREGAGPGEFANANGLVVLTNGNLVINDPDNSRLTVLGPTGDLLKTVRLVASRSFGWAWDAWVDGAGRVGENVVVRHSGVSAAMARQIWSADFAHGDTILPATCPPAPHPESEDVRYSFQSSTGGMSMGIPYAAPSGAILWAPDGGTWTSRWPTFASIIHLPAGKCDPDVTIPLVGVAIAIPAVVRDSAVERVKKAAARYSAKAPDVGKIPRTYASFDGLFLDSTGRLWIERWSDATHKRFDIHTAAGVPVAQVDEPAGFQSLRPWLVTAERMYGFVSDEDGVNYLVSYRIVK